ncbi:MAG: hypothetical protein K8M05_26790, partial [Deltaproteobacteria bacterium]|nr:hypothetical protein [Kofleriaceae bacterium]
MKLDLHRHLAPPGPPPAAPPPAGPPPSAPPPAGSPMAVAATLVPQSGPGPMGGTGRGVRRP